MWPFDGSMESDRYNEDAAPRILLYEKWYLFADLLFIFDVRLVFIYMIQSYLFHMLFFCKCANGFRVFASDMASVTARDPSLSIYFS